jgi:hypothetical protein
MPRTCNLDLLIRAVQAGLLVVEAKLDQETNFPPPVQVAAKRVQVRMARGTLCSRFI